jgi:outer membrane protein TolC
MLSATGSAQTTMTIDQARQAALYYNRSYLSAMEDTKMADAEIMRTRADALPEIRFDGGYTRTFTIPKIFFSSTDSLNNTQTMELQTGFKHGFRGTLSAKQPIWHGGTVYTAYGIAKLYKKYSHAKADQVKADVLYTADILFYQISLNQASLDVVNNQFKAASENYDVVAKMREQGVASDYELLQAAVNRDNLKPRIIAAESELTLSRRNMKSWLGINLEADVSFVETPADTSLGHLPSLELLTNTALERRPEMLQADYLVEIAQRAIRVAKGDYFPHLDAVAAYDWSSQSDEFTLDNNISKSWTAGLTISFPLFEGWRTKGNVSERTAQHHQARLNKSQAEDMIRLEVRQAFDQMLQAKKTLDVQGATIAQAEEGLKIANIRYSSGVGTQLEVLSAQAALSQARAASSLAQFQFRQALAGLKKATTVDFERESLL